LFPLIINNILYLIVAAAFYKY